MAQMVLTNKEIMFDPLVPSVGCCSVCRSLAGNVVQAPAVPPGGTQVLPRGPPMQPQEVPSEPKPVETATVFERNDVVRESVKSRLVTLNGGGLLRELPQNPLNCGLGIKVICPDVG